MYTQDIYLDTINFAAEAHKDQKVSGKDIPYVVHISFVCMEILFAFQQEPSFDLKLAIQLALLHDVIEDTDVTYEEVKEKFGQSAASGVLALSKNTECL